MVDANKPEGVLSNTISSHSLEHLLESLKEHQTVAPFEVILSNQNDGTAKHLTKKHFGRPYRETKCFRGYPTLGSIQQFHNTKQPYVLHLDCDMLFYESPNFSWLDEGIKIMEEHEDILCVLPRGGPPRSDEVLHQGTTRFKVDPKRGLYLFKNFTSRHYLIHRKRFLSLLPMKPLWLSWREPLKSRFFGNGKMLCWESIVEHALEKSNFWRADLMSNQAWSLHPGDRSDEFYNLLPGIINKIKCNEIPEGQKGYFDLRLKDWQNYLNQSD